MFNTVGGFTQKFLYWSVENRLFRVLSFIQGLFIILFLLLAQLPTTTFIQLNPGSAFFFAFFLYCFLIFGSGILFTFPQSVDAIKGVGAKASQRIFFLSSGKIRANIFFISGIGAFFTILPLSLDYFSDSTNVAFGNYWSLSEVIILEILLFFLFFFFSQFPLLFLRTFSSEKKLEFLAFNWKFLCFLSIIIAGIFTPTIDGATQLCFACSFFLFFFFFFTTLKKRFFFRFSSFSFLSG